MRHIITGIDIGTHTTRVVVSEYTQEKARPKIIGTGSSESGGMRRGYITDKTAAAKSLTLAIKEAERNSGIKIKRAYVSIGGISLSSGTASKSITLGKGDADVHHNDLARLADKAESAFAGNIQNRRILHTIPLSYKLDGQPLIGQPLGMRGAKLAGNFMFIACLEHHLFDLIDVVSSLNIQVADVIAAPLAASMPLLSPKQKAVGTLLLDIGAETVSMIVFENNAPISLEVFAIGSSNITNDIALGFRVPLEQAERIKTGLEENPAFSRRKLDDIIEARLSDIFELVDEHLKNIKRSGLLPGGIVITGGGSTLSTIEEFAKASLRLPSQVTHVQNISEMIRKMPDASWFLAYGLCFAEMGNMHTNYIPGPRGSFKLGSFGRKVRDIIEQFLP